MTQEQIDKLKGFKSLLDNGVITLDEFEREKAKILGRSVPDKSPAAPPVEESAPVSVENTLKTQPVTLKITKPASAPQGSAQKSDVAASGASSAEPPVRNNFADVPMPSVEPQSQPQAASAPSTIHNNSASAKSRTPIYIAVGMLAIILLFFLMRRNKDSFGCDSPSGYVESEMSGASSSAAVDKFERMWQIGSSRAYTYDDLAGWSKADLRILRNYYFAKNNYKFNSKELNDYFSSHYSWFRPLYSAQDSWFTPLQTQNVQFIKQQEK